MSGPDFFLFATFSSANSTTLASTVRKFKFHHFAYYHMHNQYCRQHHQQCSFDLYIDTHNYNRVVRNIEGQERQNIWIYHTIEVCQASLLIERGYGGYGGQYMLEELALLEWLAHQPHLAIQSWKTVAGGDGYAYTDEADGSSSADLLHYVTSVQAFVRRHEHA